MPETKANPTLLSEIIALAGFPATTRMLFQQTAAPTGWTKDGTHDNKSLRLVNGAVGTGGTNNFTTAFGAAVALSGSVDATTLTEAQSPSHVHAFDEFDATGGNISTAAGPAGLFKSSNTDSKGGDGSHTHSLSGATVNIDVQFVDFIIAEKD